MSRRKQARPSRVLEDEEAAGKANQVEDKPCEEDNDSVGTEDEAESMGDKREEAVRRQRQDAENNNSIDNDDDPHETSSVPGHVTLEALQNTKVAVAQFPMRDVENSVPGELSSLFSLEHQQMMHLCLIHQLQSHLNVTKEEGAESPSPSTTPGIPLPAALPLKSLRIPTPIKSDAPVPVSPPSTQSLPASKPSPQPLTIPKPPLTLTQPPPPPPPQHPPLCSISSSLASSIITNNDPPPSLNEPNTLEMLQKRAQEVLDNASQGLLANNLADELAFRKNGKNLSPLSGGRNEPFFKHRCRYCGKVFGSDSALQIHIRSHTGERPFKCNVCGSRFTTKGNLKVHFQRHTAKFPHIKMNPNPVPEHLDKFHPPLLAQIGNQSLPPSPHQPFPTTPPFPPPGLSLFRPPMPHDLMHRNPPMIPLRPHEQNLLKPLLPLSIFSHREEQEQPADLSKPNRRSSPEPSRSRSISPVVIKIEPSENEEEHSDMRVKSEDQQSNPSEIPVKSFRADSDIEESKGNELSYDDCSMDSKCSEDEGEEQPENLSGRADSPDMRTEQMRHFVNPPSPPSSNSSDRSPYPSSYTQDLDPSKDPAIYNSLLPRPGSNDNSWESLIEVTKTSETHKLQQLVDNIEHKLTDPNQCVICHRVLSCKSALQMHYRTHTGERPFRCKICGRAFTTKGNLKTHMGVHRLKPPMRVLHQCPVCHKKFTNALVLQQHIRLHTGEPTDLTPEQIHAAEIKDFPPSVGLSPGLLANLPQINLRPDMEGKEDYYDGDDDDFSNSSGSPNYPSSLHDRISAEDLTISKSSPPSIVNGRDSPISSNGVRSPSPRPSSPPTLQRISPNRPASPSPSESSSTAGALDLTPKATSRGPTPGPNLPNPIPPPNLFSGLSLISPGGPSPLMSSALSSLTSSVLTSTAFSPLSMAMGPAVRGNTTCNICFKTFACNSALEIHYRSHTKERPFKCAICDRGFSTKNEVDRCVNQWRIPRASHIPLPSCPMHSTTEGYATDWMHTGNMKQHMLTHKIRDMPPHIFENKKSPTFAGPQQPQQQSQQPQEEIAIDPPIEEQKVDSPVKLETPSSPSAKRSPPEGDLPIPKRQPTVPKHLCHVCNKNFSSSSALQIHMRTHTGDKPFRCTVCQKAFTTKGNLKVHMGTHMWSNGASRRGRRMSLDMPPIPMNHKDSDFLQRRPDLFYPYLPTPFLNGVHQKLNDLPQTPPNGLQPPKFTGLLGFTPFGEKPSPPSPHPTSPPPALSMNSRRGSPLRGAVADELPRGVWDMHFERKDSEGLAA